MYDYSQNFQEIRFKTIFGINEGILIIILVYTIINVYKSLTFWLKYFGYCAVCPNKGNLNVDFFLPTVLKSSKKSQALFWDNGQTKRNKMSVNLKIGLLHLVIIIKRFWGNRDSKNNKLESKNLSRLHHRGCQFKIGKEKRS